MIANLIFIAARFVLHPFRPPITRPLDNLQNPLLNRRPLRVQPVEQPEVAPLERHVTRLIRQLPPRCEGDTHDSPPPVPVGKRTLEVHNLFVAEIRSHAS